MKTSWKRFTRPSSPPKLRNDRLKRQNTQHRFYGDRHAHALQVDRRRARARPAKGQPTIKMCLHRRAAVSSYLARVQHHRAGSSGVAEQVAAPGVQPPAERELRGVHEDGQVERGAGRGESVLGAQARRDDVLHFSGQVGPELLPLALHLHVARGNGRAGRLGRQIHHPAKQQKVAASHTEKQASAAQVHQHQLGRTDQGPSRLTSLHKNRAQGWCPPGPHISTMNSGLLCPESRRWM